MTTTFNNITAFSVDIYNPRYILRLALEQARIARENIAIFNLSVLNRIAGARLDQLHLEYLIPIILTLDRVLASNDYDLLREMIAQSHFLQQLLFTLRIDTENLTQIGENYVAHDLRLNFEEIAHAFEQFKIQLFYLVQRGIVRN